jgi:nucleosome binding factor SPN SPT16 subunit
MSDGISIDKQLFQSRLSHFVSQWKVDKRNGDALFGGVGSILVLNGKSESEQDFHKNNGLHVSLGYGVGILMNSFGFWVMSSPLR